MRARLIRLLLWALDRLDPTAVRLLVPRDAVLAAAVALVRQWDTSHPAPGFGEMKRHQVYAQLQKDFPTAAKGDLALVIEAARREA